jgi:hypothetical protein
LLNAALTTEDDILDSSEREILPAIVMIDAIISFKV